MLKLAIKVSLITLSFNAYSQPQVHLPLTANFDDISGNDINGIPEGDIQIVDGWFAGVSGNVAYFDGSGDMIKLPFVSFQNTFSVAVWIKPEGIRNMAIVNQKAGEGANKHFHLQLRGNRNPYLGFYINDDVAENSSVDNSWHHLVFQYNGSQQEIWVDGEMVSERAAEPYLGDSGMTFIGQAPWWGNVNLQDFKGFMRDLRIYDYPLSTSEVAELKSNL